MTESKRFPESGEEAGGAGGPFCHSSPAAVWEGTAPGDSLMSDTGLSLGPTPRGDL